MVRKPSELYEKYVLLKALRHIKYNKTQARNMWANLTECMCVGYTVDPACNVRVSNIV
jgi:hypothetical protein